jgi:hypothetical protein
VASNYTGNQGSTQAPSGPPTPAGNPIVSLPADGDSLNAASVAQGFKVGMDWIAWLTKPRAIASAWAQAIKIFRSGPGHQRFGIDHLGYPAGRLNHWREAWPTNASPSIAMGGTGGLLDAAGWGWESNAVAGIPYVSVHSPDTNWSQRYVEMQSGNGLGDNLTLYRYDSARFTADALIALEWDLDLTDPSGNVENFMGFNGHEPTHANSARAQFHWPATGTNWLCETHDGTTLSSIDSGVAATAGWHRYRIEYHGANVDDAGVERVVFFIDGVLVANKTNNMPSAVTPDPNARVCFAQRQTTAAALAFRQRIGNVLFTSNPWRDAF